MQTENSIDAKVSALKFNNHKIELSTNPSGKPVARLFKFMTSGNKKNDYKLLEGFYFKDEKKRDEWIAEKVKIIKTRDEEKKKDEEQKSAIRKNMQHDFKVGQIYDNSWGYDQTNVDFYEVVEVNTKRVVIRMIAGVMVPSEGYSSMAGMIKPLPGNYIGQPETKLVQFYLHNGKPTYYIKAKFGSMSLYTSGDTGTYVSWYA